MGPLYNINDHILISNPYYSDVYQEKSEKLELYQEIMFLDWNQTKIKTAETVVHITHAIINI